MIIKVTKIKIFGNFHFVYISTDFKLSKYAKILSMTSSIV